jgi:hypothetical protein
MSAPTQAHWSSLTRVLKYIKGTLDLAITYGTQGLIHDPYALCGYADADYLGDPTVKSRSMSGYLFQLNGGPVSWKSKLQTVVALSSAESEYMALCAGVQHAVFLRAILSDMELSQSPTLIWQDNQSCIALAQNSLTNSRTKHIDVKFHFIREKILSEEIIVKYCPTAEMLADIFTKAFAAERHGYLSRLIMGLANSA